MRRIIGFMLVMILVLSGCSTLDGPSLSSSDSSSSSTSLPTSSSQFSSFGSSSNESDGYNWEPETIKSFLQRSFPDYQVGYDEDSDIYTFVVESSGLLDLFESVISGNEENAESLESIVESLVSLSNSCLGLIEEMGSSGANVRFSLVDSSDPDVPLLIVDNDEITYDARAVK